MKDINFESDNIKFTCRACALIFYNNKILFQKRKTDTSWALPGGKIELLETVENTIKRELSEELGITDITIEGTSSITENFFEFNGKKNHQYIFTQKVIFNDKKYNSIETEFSGIEKDKDVVFKWIDLSDLNNYSLKPDYVKNQVLNQTSNIQFLTAIE